MSQTTPLDKTKEPIVVLSQKYWQFAQGEKKRIAVYLTLSALAMMMLLTGPVIFGQIIKEIETHGISESNGSTLLFLLSLIWIKEICFWMLHGPSRILERQIAFRVGVKYRQYLTEGVLRQDISWHNSRDSGETIDKVQQSIAGLTKFGGDTFQIVQVVMRIIGTVLAICYFSPWVGALVFALVVTSLFVITAFDSKMLPQYKALNEFSNRGSASVFDALSNITTVKILTIEPQILKGIMARYTAPFAIFSTNVKYNEWKWFTSLMFAMAINVLPLTVFVGMAYRGTSLNAGHISTLYLYLSELVIIYFTFGTIYEQLFVCRNQVLNTQDLEKQIDKTQFESKRKLHPSKKLNFQELNFRYEASEKEIFKGLEIDLSVGEKIALVGESGSGKTTLLKAIHGILSPCLSLIKVDEEKEEKIELSKVDLSTMLVPQEPEIFSATIRENITLGMDCSEEDIMAAVKNACFDSTLASLPRGLDSVINEKGVNLSGGQKQRLALARAILFGKNKELILLDESTSSVDPKNEMVIYKNLFAIFQGRTILASIHKLHLLRFFDRILYFRGDGTAICVALPELLASESRFRKMWEEMRDEKTF